MTTCLPADQTSRTSRSSPAKIKLSVITSPFEPTSVIADMSMAQGQKADEFVTLEQLAACDAMLAALIERLEKGVG